MSCGLIIFLLYMLMSLKKYFMIFKYFINFQILQILYHYSHIYREVHFKNINYFNDNKLCVLHRY